MWIMQENKLKNKKINWLKMQHFCYANVWFVSCFLKRKIMLAEYTEQQQQSFWMYVCVVYRKSFVFYLALLELSASTVDREDPNCPLEKLQCTILWLIVQENFILNLAKQYVTLN